MSKNKKYPLINLGQERESLKIAIDNNLPCLLIGEAGTGKNSLVYDIALENKKTTHRFSITGETTVDDFVGKFILKDGETVWVDGILLTAMKNGDYLVVDEINAADAQVLFILHSLLDDDKSLKITQNKNEVVEAHKDFRFFATMNPPAEYAGTNELNKAFLSRCAVVINLARPNRSTIKSILVSRGVKKRTADGLAHIYSEVCALKDDGIIDYTISTRDCIYAGLISLNTDLTTGFNLAILNKSQDDAEKIIEVCQPYLGPAAFPTVKTIEEIQIEKDKAQTQLNKVHTNIIKKEKDLINLEKQFNESLVLFKKLIPEINEFVVLDMDDLDNQMVKTSATDIPSMINALDNISSLTSLTDKDIKKLSISDLRNKVATLEADLGELKNSSDSILKSFDQVYGVSNNLTRKLKELIKTDSFAEFKTRNENE